MHKDNLTNLVEEYRNGNVSVFDELYNRTINDMYRYARKLTNDDSIIEDAIQDSYIKMADSIESLRDSSSFCHGDILYSVTILTQHTAKERKSCQCPFLLIQTATNLSL